MPRLLVASALTLTVLIAGSVTAHAADNDFVKYYIVAESYQGRQENLSDIALRLLGDAGRAGEIFDVNSGRTQPDGGKLTDPARLRAGWALVLPWDAYGDGVRYGVLPSAPPVPASTYTGPAAAPSLQAAPSPEASPAAVVPTGECASTPTSRDTASSQWAFLRVAAELAWPYTTGHGVPVAVVDSGVDASLPGLAGHVTVGADIVSGSGRGDTDCLGTGTAMAGLIAAHSGQGGGITGVAPDATVVPVRVVTTNPQALPQDQATAIEVATAAGVKVIALGSYVNPADPGVAAAIANATRHDAIVVLGAQITGTVATRPPQVLRVGGVGMEGQLAAEYVPGAVDVVAPGVDVSSLGITGNAGFHGSGTQYAVAFVAGTAALVRSRYPNLTAAQVARRVMATADHLGPALPDARYGWGMINPLGAVTQVVDGEAPVTPRARTTPSGQQASAGRTVALVILAVVALVVLLALAFRLRRTVRLGAGAGEGMRGGPHPGDVPPGDVPPGGGLPARTQIASVPFVDDAALVRQRPRATGQTADIGLASREDDILSGRGLTSRPPATIQRPTGS